MLRAVLRVWASGLGAVLRVFGSGVIRKPNWASGLQGRWWEGGFSALWRAESSVFGTGGLKVPKTWSKLRGGGGKGALWRAESAENME